MSLLESQDRVRCLSERFDKLRMMLNDSSEILLSEIVLVGDQNSGKLSVLISISGMCFSPLSNIFSLFLHAMFWVVNTFANILP